jgi:DHA3 family macrolide efflux protein-like MFS transporter
MIMGLAAPVGLAIATPLGELIGVRWLFVVVGALGGLVVLLGFLSPVLRAMDQVQSMGAQKAD